MHQNEILGGWKTFSNKGLTTVVTINNNYYYKYITK